MAFIYLYEFLLQYVFFQFSGNWYEFERIDNTFETDACSSFTLTRVLTHNRNYMFVSNQEVVDGKLSIRYFPSQRLQFIFCNTNYFNFNLLYFLQMVFHTMLLYWKRIWKISQLYTVVKTLRTGRLVSYLYYL